MLRIKTALLTLAALTGLTALAPNTAHAAKLHPITINALGCEVIEGDVDVNLTFGEARSKDGASARLICPIPSMAVHPDHTFDILELVYRDPDGKNFVQNIQAELYRVRDKGTARAERIAAVYSRTRSETDLFVGRAYFPEQKLDLENSSYFVVVTITDLGGDQRKAPILFRGVRLAKMLG